MSLENLFEFPKFVKLFVKCEPMYCLPLNNYLIQMIPFPGMYITYHISYRQKHHIYSLSSLEYSKKDVAYICK